MIEESSKLKRIEKSLFEFLSSRIRQSLISEDARKITLINVFALFGIFYLMFYSYRMFLSGDYRLSVIYLFLIGVLIAVQVYLKYSRRINLCSHISIISLFILEIFFLIRNGSTILNIKSYYIFPGIYWYYAFPLLSIFLLGRKVGSIYNIILIFITICFFSIDSPITELYDTEFKVRFLSIYSAIFFFVFFFESIRVVTFEAFLKVQEKNDEHSKMIIEKRKDLNLIKRIEKSIYEFLSSKIRGSLINEDVRKVTLINIFALFGLFYLLFYSYRMYLSGDYKLSIIYLFFVGVIISMQVFLRYSRKIILSSHIFVLSLFCLELYFLVRNGSTILNVKSYYIFPGIYWYYAFPLLSLFLLGRKAGSIYNIILIALTISFFSIDSPLTQLYDTELKVRFLSIYSAIFFFAFFFESIRVVTFEAFLKMQKKNTEYSKRIMEKNKDLNRTNRDLLMLTEEVRVQMEYQKDLNVMLEVKNEQIVSQNRQLELQSNEISNQRDQLLIQKQNITDSILYASHIQKALLPNEDILGEKFSDFFILYKPRDIIGGDFYYVKNIDDTIVLAVADCTGHGVPGALLSMLGISYLNEIIHTKELSETNAILNEMRNKIKLALHQSNQTRETKDGMDMALVAIDSNNNVLKYSGANNPVYIIRNSELTELKADKMPIGIQPREKPDFTNLEFQLQKNDCIYLFSDGYPDQLERGTMKKFSLKNFQKLLLSVNDLSMSNQRDELERVIENWRSDTDQTDDILVVGVRI